ncbi:hypothetical protein ACFYV7_11335 [Nocardia suismassiliense]|uniref:Uncharacterized protein n=1 Tax=Nocardia suismassiliense TaxID=2077092 RepID=A0ABW6QQ79_9NOCA
MSSRPPSRRTAPLPGLRCLQPPVRVVPLRATLVCASCPRTTTPTISGSATELIQAAPITPAPVSTFTSTAALLSTGRRRTTTRAIPASATELIQAAPNIPAPPQPVATTRSAVVLIAAPVSTFVPSTTFIGATRRLATVQPSVITTARRIARRTATTAGAVIITVPIKNFARVAVSGTPAARRIVVAPAGIRSTPAPRITRAPDATDLTRATTVAAAGDIVAAHFTTRLAARAATVVPLDSTARLSTTPGVSPVVASARVVRLPSTLVIPARVTGFGAGASAITALGTITSVGATPAVATAPTAFLTPLGPLPFTGARPPLPLDRGRQLDDVPHPVTIHGDHQIRTGRPQSIRHPVERPRNRLGATQIRDHLGAAVSMNPGPPLRIDSQPNPGTPPTGGVTGADDRFDNDLPLDPRKPAQLFGNHRSLQRPLGFRSGIGEVAAARTTRPGDGAGGGNAVR